MMQDLLDKPPPLKRSDLNEIVCQSGVAEDYDFDEETVEQITDLLYRHLNHKAGARLTPKDAGERYVGQVTRLRDAAEVLRNEIWSALANRFIYAALPRR